MNHRIGALIQENEVLRHYCPRLFDKKSGGWFLDLSCGTRPDIREIVESFGYRWVGVDHIDHPRVIKADAHALPFHDSRFDIVYASAAFEHYRDPWRVADELKRVLRSGGHFCGLIAFIQPWHGDSYYHFSHLGVAEMLRRMDFEVLDIHAGDVDGATYLIRVLFHYWRIGRALSVYGRLLYSVRRRLFPLLVRCVFRGKKERLAKELAVLRDDDLRFAASIIFLSRKREGPDPDNSRK
jgi:ubiquinone/menaquinone biosynthesis C-methylase UbiE